MGGGKKPTISQMEKALKKEEEKRKSVEQKKLITIPKEIGTEEILEKIKDLDAITAHSLALRAQIGLGDAKRVLRELSKAGIINQLSSFNGHPVYSLNSSNAKPTGPPDTIQ